MSNVTELFPRPITDPVVINEEYFATWTNEMLAFKAWEGCDLAQEILFDEESDTDSYQDIRYEVLIAQYALRVLVRRLTGRDAAELQAECTQKLLASFHAEIDS